MNLSTRNLARARRFAAVAVAGSVAVVALAGLVLPSNVAGVLPLLGLTVPLIAAGFLESRIGRLSAHA